MENQKKTGLKKLKAKWSSLSKKQKIIYITIIVVLIGVLGSKSEDSDTPETTVETQVNADSVNDEIEVESEVEAETEDTEETPSFEELTFEEQVKEVANKISHDKVQQVLIGNGELSIDIEMTENFTNKLMVSGMESQAFSILKQLQGIVEGQGIDYISVFFTASFIDKYGNESEDNAGIFAVHTEELMKVNFDNLSSKNLENFCSTTYIHPAFTK